MGAFHIFKIVQIVPNRTTHHTLLTNADRNFKVLPKYYLILTVVNFLKRLMTKEKIMRHGNTTPQKLR